MKLVRCIFSIVFVLTIYPIYQMESRSNNYDHMMMVLLDHCIFGIDDDHK